MTPNELKTFYEELIDDTTLSQSTIFTYFSNALNAIWLKRPWEIAKKTDDTKSTTVGGTTITFPTDFLSPIKMYIGDTEIMPIKKEDRRLFKDSNLRYYTDWANSYFKLTYSPTSAETVYLDYIYEPTDPFTTALQDTDIKTTIPGFIKAFHPLVAYEAAKMFYAQEVGSKNDNWWTEFQLEYDKLYSNMEKWDASLKSNAQNTSIATYGATNRSDVIE